jgi:diguanylate cyclase (GGDEF)-like protein
VTTSGELGNYDALTGLLTRSGFDLIAEQVIARAAREAEEISLACFRLIVENGLDELVAAEVREASLLQLSELLRTELRASDVVSRVDVNELAVLLPNTNADQAHAVIEQLSSVVAREALTFNDAFAEVGISTFDPQTRTCDLEAMLDLAHVEVSFTNLCWA